jgi:tRNA(Ile)-lysidine synthase TilS/MesJ
VKRCSHCILPDTFPGIQFDEEGICQHCRRMPDAEHLAARKARLRARFEELVRQVRSRPGHHCLMAWSGGKDSTYTLWLLRKQYGLRVLAFTLDNSFVSPQALKNMRVVAENLQVDHAIVKPRFDLLRQIFVASMQPGMYPPKALERASGICNSCMAIAKGVGLRMALEENIPILAYGWSPGQIPLASAFFHTNPQMLRAMIETAVALLEKALDGRIAVYFPEEYHLENIQESPYNVSPLAFLDYDEETALKRIGALAWERPQDTDPNSTNCLLNSFANLIHLEQTGYHPYVMELAGLVREGYLERQEALDRLEIAPAPAIVAAVEAKLGIPPSRRRDR